MTDNPYAAWKKFIDEYHNNAMPQPQQPNQPTDSVKKEQK